MTFPDETHALQHRLSRHPDAVSAGVATDCVEVPAGHHRDGRVWPRVLPITPVREFPAAGV